MDGISLGSAYLRLYGDRSALDRELEKLKRYTDQLERQGIKVKFDADTGKATREIDGLQNRLNRLQQALNQVGKGIQGDGDAWKELAENIGGLGSKAAASGGAMGRMGGMLGQAAGAASKAIPILGQLGLAAMGLQAIFQGVTGAINGILAPLKQLSAEAGRFNQQVAEASIFAANSFSTFGPDGKAITGTANQMRALRGTISKEYREIQKEVAKISGATSAEVYDAFNIILQNVGSLGAKGEDLGNVRKLATRVAAGMNTLGVPKEQLRSEMYSLMTGDVQIYDKLGRDLYGPNAAQEIKKLQAEGKYYDDLMQKLDKLYDGQTVLSESLTNVASNFEDVFQTINTGAGQALERGLAKMLKNVLDPLTALQDSFMGFARGTNEFLEPILKLLGEIGGWFVSAGSIIASTLQVVMDVLAAIANFLGALILPTLRTVGKIFTVIAKAFQLVAELVSAVVRPLTVFFRILGDQDSKQVDNVFQPLIDALDTLIGYAEKAGQVIAKPFIAAAKAKAWTQGKLSGKSDEQIKAEQDAIQAEFDKALGVTGEVDLRSLKLLRPTEDLLREVSERYGSGRSRQLQIAKETSQLVQDRLKNEITGLEQGLKLMQAQKSVQEALNQLAEGRRGLAMSRANFAVQLASSPEARLAAEERRNDLANRQEQERISERRALLGTEREMLQTQLKIQLKQQQIQQEQLKIQRAEIQIMRLKAQDAARDIVQKINNAAPGSKEQLALKAQWKVIGQEIQLRDQQMEIMNRTVSLSYEASNNIRTTNSLELRRLGIQGEQLDVQSQAANLTREQQRLMAELQRQEQALKNAYEAKVNANNALIKGLEQEKQLLEDQQKLSQELEKLDKARMEARKAMAEAAVTQAERELKVAQAQQAARGGSTRDAITAQIESIAAGTRGYVDAAAATKRLYEAKDRQLKIEQAIARQQLLAQHERERSELRIAQIQLKVLELQSLNQQAQLTYQQQQLNLQNQRDRMAGGAPAAPVLPPPSGPQSFPGGAVTSRRRDPDAERTGWDIVMPGGRGAPVRAPIDLTITGTGFQGRGAGATGRGYGNWVTGEFELGGKKYELLLGHFDRVDVAKGMKVPAGTQLGTQGITGRTFGTHATTHVNPLGGASTADAWNALESLTRVWERGFAGGSSLAGRGGTGAVTSLENAVDANTTAQEANNQALDRIRAQQGQMDSLLLPQLNERQAADLNALRAREQLQQDNLNYERIREELTAQFLNSDRGRLAAQIADAMSEGVSTALRGAFNAIRTGGSFDDAVQSAFEAMGEKVLASLLDFALAPLQNTLQKTIFGGLSGFDADKEAAKRMGGAALPGTVTSGGSGNQILPSLPSGSSNSLRTLPYTPSQDGFYNTPELQTATDGLKDSINQTSSEIRSVGTAAANTPSFFTQLNGAVGSFVQLLGGVALGISGAQQIGKGGTYNTLMGIASIFGGIASVASLGSSIGGLFKGGGASMGGSNYWDPKTGLGVAGPNFGLATGGQVQALQPYLVGEQGPELFVPGSAGQIFSNGRTQAVLASRSALGGGLDGNQTVGTANSQAMNAFATNRSVLSSTSTITRESTTERMIAASLAAPTAPMSISYESSIINSVEYVTADQFRKGMTDAAERGRALTLGALKNSVKARRQVGI